jgi:hypothetical protein
VPKEILITLILAIAQIPIGILGGTMPQQRSKVPPISSAVSVLLILGLLVLYWQERISQNSVLYAAIILTGVVVVVLIINVLRQRESRKQLDMEIQSLNAQLGATAIKENVADALEKLRQGGKLENVSRQDANWMMAKAIEMTVYHGHDDLLGLFADRASNVPLNELMTRLCSKCSVPRNQQGKSFGELRNKE